MALTIMRQNYCGRIVSTVMDASLATQFHSSQSAAIAWGAVFDDRFDKWALCAAVVFASVVIEKRAYAHDY